MLRMAARSERLQRRTSGPLALIDPVALIARRAQAGAAGDGLGVGVVLDRPHLAGEVGGADDVDAGEGQQQDVGRLRQAAGDVAFQGLDFLGFSLRDRRRGPGRCGGAGRRRRRPAAACSAQSRTVCDGALLEADAGLARGCDTGLSLRRRGVPAAEAKWRSRCQGDGAVPELVEAGGEAGQGGFEVLADLAVQGRAPCGPGRGDGG